MSSNPIDPPTIPNAQLDAMRAERREEAASAGGGGSGGRTLLLLGLLLVVLGLGWWFWSALFAPESKPAQLAQTPAEPPKAAAPAPPAEPVILHPIDEAPVAGAPPLPKLAESDKDAGEGLAALLGKDAYARYFVSQDLVRRIVATVDNLPRKTYAQRLSPVKPVAGAFLVSGKDPERTIDAKNAARYTPYVRVLDAVDARKLVALYVRLYPLFQEAYQELGYPKAYFNDRLVQALDVMIATPSMPGQLRVTQPKVFYQYADENLEALPSGQKILLRIGPENAARVRAKLVEIRKLVAKDGAAAKEAAKEAAK